MRFRHIELFHAVMIAGSVSGAAERLGVSQPSVTKALKQLEDEVGYLLFDRIRGRLHPTAEARVLMQEAERAKAALDDVRRTARRLKSGAETQLRVVATPALGLDVLPDAVSRFSSDHPDVRFHVSTRHSAELLREMDTPSYGYDLGILFDASDRPASVGAEIIGEVPVACLFHRDLFAGGRVRLSELEGHSVIGLEESEPLGQLLARADPDATFVMDPTIRVQTYHMAGAFASRGHGIAIVDAMTSLNYAAARDDVGIAELDGFSLPVTAVYPLTRGLPVRTKRLVEAATDALATATRQFRRRIGLF
jgi:DNA-binding transcriptional LysR family regulator